MHNRNGSTNFKSNNCTSNDTTSEISTDRFCAINKQKANSSDILQVENEAVTIFENTELTYPCPSVIRSQESPDSSSTPSSSPEVTCINSPPLFSSGGNSSLVLPNESSINKSAIRKSSDTKFFDEKVALQGNMSILKSNPINLSKDSILPVSCESKTSHQNNFEDVKSSLSPQVPSINSTTNINSSIEHQDLTGQCVTSRLPTCVDEPKIPTSNAVSIHSHQDNVDSSVDNAAISFSNTNPEYEDTDIVDILPATSSMNSSETSSPVNNAHNEFNSSNPNNKSNEDDSCMDTISSIGFPSDDVTDLSVANDLLFLSQSESRFTSTPDQCVDSSKASVPVESVPCNSIKDIDSGTELSDNSKHVPNIPLASNMFGSRHLLCQALPSQSRSVTARAKPISQVLLKVPYIKTESKDYGFDNLSTNEIFNNKQMDIAKGSPKVVESLVHNRIPRRKGKPLKFRDSPDCNKNKIFNQNALIIPRVSRESKTLMAPMKKNYSKLISAINEKNNDGKPKFHTPKQYENRLDENCITKVKSEKLSPGPSIPYNGSYILDKEQINSGVLNIKSETVDAPINQIPINERLNMTFDELKHSVNRIPTEISKKRQRRSRGEISDSSSSRESSTASFKRKTQKILSKVLKNKYFKVSKKSSKLKSRCKKSLISYLKDKNECDSSNVDSDVPNSAVVDNSETNSTNIPSKLIEFPPKPAKFFRKRHCSGSSKTKPAKKPKWIHGWAWEGEAYEGKIWLRVRIIFYCFIDLFNYV